MSEQAKLTKLRKLSELSRKALVFNILKILQDNHSEPTEINPVVFQGKQYFLFQDLAEHKKLCKGNVSLAINNLANAGFIDAVNLSYDECNQLSVKGLYTRKIIRLNTEFLDGFYRDKINSVCEVLFYE